MMKNTHKNSHKADCKGRGVGHRLRYSKSTFGANSSWEKNKHSSCKINFAINALKGVADSVCVIWEGVEVRSIMNRDILKRKFLAPQVL